MKRKASKGSVSMESTSSESSTKDTSYSFGERRYEKEVRRLCEEVWATGRLKNALKPANWDSSYSLHLFVGTAKVVGELT